MKRFKLRSEVEARVDAEDGRGGTLRKWRLARITWVRPQAQHQSAGAVQEAMSGHKWMRYDVRLRDGSQA